MTTIALNPPAEQLRQRMPVLPSKPLANRLDMRLSVQHGVLTAHLVGDLDGESAPLIVRRMADLAARGRVKLVLELRQLFSVDVEGLAALRDAAALLNECGGWLALVALRPRVRQFLERTGTADQFSVYKSVEEAARAETGKAAVFAGPAGTLAAAVE
ncbi:MAG TPA: anti-sigma factor antagonist [Actinocrinis sp.]|nr:anti-sigma factor antagonist [Actinocrinis sp.]